MIYEFYQRHKRAVLTTGVVFALFMLFVYGIWSYPLIDVDETRYVSMAREMLERKNWFTLYMNGDFFFEKPPLYFWIVAFTFKFFGVISEFTSRIGVTLIALLGVFGTYYFARRTVSHSFGVISAAILSTTFFYLMLSHIAILDMVLSVFIMLSVFAGFLSLYAKEENQKYYWWAAYLFSGLSVMAKGIPGLAIPALTLFFGFWVTKNLKQLFKPINIIPGLGILACVILPWHIIMCKIHGGLFFNEYVMKHHIARFLNSENLGRKQPFLFYVPIILGGIFPWTFILISYIFKVIRNVGKKIKAGQPLIDMSNKYRAVTLFSWIYVGVTFLFFSVSSTKLPTYVLPLFAPLALLLGTYWHQYLYENKNNKGIFRANEAFVYFLILAAIALIIVPSFLKGEIVIQLRQMSIFVVTFFMCFAGIIHYFNKNREREHLFIMYIIFTILTVFVCIKDVTNIVVSGGENQLIEYAKYVKKMPDAKLVTYNFGVRPSVLYYFGQNIQFLAEPTEKTKEDLEEQLNSKVPVFVIVKNKNNDTFKNARVIKEGTKYTLWSN